MRKNKKGSILAYALVMMMVVSIILVSILQYITSQIQLGSYRLEKEKSFQVAEAGVYYYRWYLAHTVAGKTAAQIKAFWEGGTALGLTATEVEFYDPEGGAIGRYKLEVTAPDSDSTIVMVKSTGWTYKEPNTKRIIQARFRRPSWSENIVTSNSFVKFGAGTFNGKIHSNGGMRMDGTISNVASSAIDVVDDPDHAGASEFGVHTHRDVNSTNYNDNFRPNEAPNNVVPTRADIFLAGRQFPVASIDFNGVSSDLGAMKTEAQKPSGATINTCTATGCYFDSTGNGRKIILKSNGTFDICKVNTYDANTFVISNFSRVSGAGTCTTCSGVCLQTFSIPNKGIIFVEDNIWLSGTIDTKKVTIVAADMGAGTPDVIFGESGSNLLYTNADGKDIIGVIAERDIRFAQSSPNNLVIDAALLAKDGKINAGCYVTPYKNSITINGAMATNGRYALLVGCPGVSGFNGRNLNFDNNLLYFPPPYFPTGTEYAIDQWDEL